MAKEFNFADAGNQNKSASKKEEKVLKDTRPPPLPFAHLEEVIESSKSFAIDFESKDMLKIIEHYRGVHDEIERKLDEAYQGMGWTKQSIETFLNNPNNFEGDEWARIQKERDALMKTLKTKRDLALEEKTGISLTPKGKTGQAKDLRGKTVGARRNWISMR